MTSELEMLNTGIGTKDPVTLKPAKCKIVEVKIGEIGEKKAKIVELYVKHPDKAENIRMNEAKIIKDDKVSISALWFNLDEDMKIKKNSALAVVLKFFNKVSPAELKDLEVDAIEGSKGYLCIKAY